MGLGLVLAFLRVCVLQYSQKPTMSKETYYSVKRDLVVCVLRYSQTLTCPLTCPGPRLHYTWIKTVFTTLE